MMKTVKYIPALLILICLLSAWKAEAQNLPVLTYRHDGVTHLRWPALHETRLRGYNVYRKAAGDNDWQRLTGQPQVMARSVQQIRQVLGFKTEMYLQLFGSVNPVRDIDDQAYQAVIDDETSLAFLNAMSLINPEFGKPMGVIFADSTGNAGDGWQYKITVVRDDGESDYAISGIISSSGNDAIPVVKEVEGIPGHQSALVRWEKSAEDLASGRVVTYAVYRSGQLLGTYERVNLFGLLPVTVKSGDHESRKDREEFTDSYLENGRTYYYYIKALNAFGFEGPASVTVEVVPGDRRPPSPPYGIQAEAYGTGLKLTWEHRDGVPVNFEVFRSNDRGGAYHRIYPLDDILLRPDRFMIDLDAETATPYYYFLRAVSPSGLRSVPSDTLPVFLADKVPPSAPGPVAARGETGRIILSWPPNKEKDIRGYHVERSSDDTFKSRFLLTSGILTDTTYTDSLPPGSETTYGYVVYAIDGSYNRSLPSALVKARMPDQTPPSPPIITKLDRKGKLVTIEWTRSTEPDLAAYRILRSKDSPDNLRQVAISFRNKHTDTLEVSGQYFYAVAAMDSTGNESRFSATVPLTFDRYETPETPPSGKAERAGAFIRVEWQAVTQPGTAGYVVTRLDENTGKKLDVAQLKAEVTNYTDRFADPGKEYLYLVRTYDERWRMSEALELRYKP